MLEPAPTTQIDPELARGRLEEVVDATATKPGYLVLSFANTGYRLHASAYGQAPEWLGERVGKGVVGTLRADARRIDVVGSGGRFVDPLMGRPRKLHGRVIAVNPSGNTVTISCPMAVVVKPTAPGQKAGDFEVGQLIACGIKPGLSFEAKRG